ncbi:MAG: hypothetical protein OHK0011_23640 [Turneriella sp.]
MYWLRSALLYLFVTVLLCAGIWLFWGDAISHSLKNQGRNVRKDSGSRMASTVKEKAPTARKVKEDKLPVKAEQAAISGKQAWEKASSGFEQLMQTAAEDNRRLLSEADREQERRFRAIFHKAAVQQPTSQVEQQLPKSVEQRPSAPLAR